MDNKRLEALASMKFYPILDTTSSMYETIVNYSRELWGPRRVAFYSFQDKWKNEYSYPSEEILGFELQDEYLDKICKEEDPCIVSSEDTEKIGINLEGVTIFLPLGGEHEKIGILILAGVKLEEEVLKSEISILKIFSHILETFISSTKLQIESNDLREKFKAKIEGADILDSIKNDIISMISRNLRTPLTSIIAYTETLLGEGISREERTEFLQTIYKESNKLKESVNETIDYITLLTEGEQ